MPTARAYHGVATIQSPTTGYYVTYVVGGSSLGSPTKNGGALASVEVFG